jgi:hypothetical protein
VSTSALPRLGVLSCLGGHDPETSLFIAHCLDFDLVESAPTWQKAWENLKLVVKHHIEYCYYNNPKGLTFSAPAHDWKRFAALIGSSTENLRVVESITIDLRPPLPATDIPVWIHGVTAWQAINSEPSLLGR